MPVFGSEKAFGIGVFNAGALLHNLREQDWGLPLSELRDMFGNTPRVPLLPGGEGDLRSALFEAIDTDASHIQMSIQLTVPTATKDKVTEAAQEAGLPPTVRNL